MLSDQFLRATDTDHDNNAGSRSVGQVLSGHVELVVGLYEVIVPALIIFSGMSMSRAVGTSLMAIAMISSSGVAFQVWSGQTINVNVTLLFSVGGLGGLWIGQTLGHRLSPFVLQRIFALAILAVAVFVLFKNLSLS